MAPVIRDTVMGVNALLNVVLQNFPPSSVEHGTRAERAVDVQSFEFSEA